MEVSDLKVYVPFMLFIFVLFLFHYPIVTHTSDDIGFAEGLNTLFKLNGENFVVNLYFHWSSRIVTNFFLPVLCNLPGEVWKLLDSLIILIMSVLMPRILLNFENLSNKRQLIYNSMSCLLFFLFYLSSYQYDLQAPAGYITTTLNYVWPLSFAVIHFYLVKKYIFNGDLNGGLKKGLIYFLAIFSLIFAINQELMLIIVFGVYIFMLVCFFLGKMKVPKSYIIFFMVIIVGVLMICMSPGNRERGMVLKAALSSNQISLMDKADVGFNLFFHGLITHFDLISYLFFGVFGFYTFIVSKHQKISLFSFLPFILMNFSYFSSFIQFKFVLSVFEGGKYSFIDSNLFYICIVLSFILATCFSLALIYLSGKRWVGGLLFCLFLLGFVSQFCMGFFPSDFGYLHRWIIFYWCLMVFSSAILVYDLLESFSKDSVCLIN
ncbi:MAG: hypothetical protein LBB45_06505 [Methanobrevibacter sp.]|jgi:hypothetical protein|nr:hypothetical protein [Candidatus Methanovirga basalitermitum]